MKTLFPYCEGAYIFGRKRSYWVVSLQRESAERHCLNSEKRNGCCLEGRCWYFGGVRFAKKEVLAKVNVDDSKTGPVRLLKKAKFYSL